MPEGDCTRRRRPFVARQRSWRSLCALALLVCTSSVQAQLFVGAGQRDRGPAQPPHPSVARIVVPEADGVSYGSGSLIDVREGVGLVITNWHVVAEATGQITVLFPDGFQSPGRVLRTDKDWDLAAVAIWKPLAQPIPLSASAPKPGEPLAIAGYGSGQYRLAVGRCTQYLAPSERLPYEMVELSAEARQGDSGGPILNQRGEIAGVLFGAAKGTTSGSFCGRVRQFLGPILSGSEQLAQIEAAPEQSSPQQLAQTQPAPDRLSHHPSETPEVPSTPLISPPPAEASVEPGPAGDIGPIGAPASLSPTITQPNVTPSAPAFEGPPPRKTETVALAPIERRFEDSGYTPLPPRGGRGGPANSGSQFGSGLGEGNDPYRALWRQIAGHTTFDQGKTIFAALGMLTILYRFLGRESAPEGDGDGD